MERAGNRTGVTARDVQKQLAEYFMTEEGQVEWQYRYA
jgi:hypothetical protein